MSRLRRLLDSYRGRDLSPTVRGLGLASFCQDVASEMVYPLLPLFLAGLGGGAALLGAMESAAEGVLALVKGWAGQASDRAGVRRPFVVAGYALSAATRPLMAIAGGVGQVVGLRALDRVAKGLRSAPRDAMIADDAPPERRAYAFAFQRSLDHLGAAVGPLLAAGILLASPGNLRLVFALATVPAVVGPLVVLWRTRDAPRRTAAAKPRATLLAVPPRLRRPLLAFALFALGNASDAFLLLRASALGVGTVGLAVVWSLFHIAKSLAATPGGMLADRFGRRPTILGAWLIYAGVYVGFALDPDVVWLPGLFLAYAAFYGASEGAEKALVVELAGSDVGTGSSLGAFHLATGVGTFLASLLFGLLWELVSPAAAFATGAACALLATALLASTRSPATRSPATRSGQARPA
jgi:MFS family permease